MKNYLIKLGVKLTADYQIVIEAKNEEEAIAKAIEIHDKDRYAQQGSIDTTDDSFKYREEDFDQKTGHGISCEIAE